MQGRRRGARRRRRGRQCSARRRTSTRAPHQPPHTSRPSSLREASESSRRSPGTDRPPRRTTGQYGDRGGVPATEGPGMQRPTTLRRTTRVVLRTLAALASGWLVLVAAPGGAHVEIDPGTATQGGYTAISFRVPNETDATSTTKVQVFLPQDHPLASVSVKPLAGWHVAVVGKKLPAPLATDDGEVTEAPYRITWTADSKKDAIAPGEYVDFDLSVGPLPEVSSLTFKTLQTYSDGSV